MGAVRKYIQVPKWYGDDIDIVANNIQFLKDLEQLCIDSGLVKSNIPENMNPTTFDMSAWFALNKDKLNYQSVPTLYFDMVGPTQVSLPVTVGFTLGFYKYNAGSNYPRFVRLLINVTCGGNIIYTSNFCGGETSAVNSNQALITGPYIYDDEADSYIYNSDGFLSINICNAYSQSAYIYSPIYRPPSSLGSINIERSYNDVGEYTAENINVFLPYGSGLNEKTIKNIVITDTEVFTDTLSSFTYFNKKNTLYDKGNLVCHAVYHVFNDSSLKPSPNMLVINNGILKPTQEIDIKINDGLATRFISLNNGNVGVFNGMNTTNTVQNMYLRTDANVIVRYGT